MNNRLDRFLLGMSMSALNPAQIPFWFIWTGYFLKPGLAQTRILPISIYLHWERPWVLLRGLVVYLYGGNWLVTKMKTSNRTLNKIMGVIFIIAAIAQLYRVFFP